MKWLFFVLSLLLFLNFSHLVYFNIFTHSLPYGVYMKINGTPQRDDYAATCLTPEIARYGIQRGYLAVGQCSTGTVLVLKIIKGIAGDYFVFKEGSLELNNISYPLHKNDSQKRPLEVFYRKKEGVLKPGEYMLISTFSKNSWDSRYWGPVPIEFLLRPLWIAEEKGDTHLCKP